MLIVLTNSEDATATFLIPILEKAGIPLLRLDTDLLLPRIQLAYRLGKPAIRIDGFWHSANEVTDIWYRRPEDLKDARFDNSPESKYARSEWTEFLECFFAHVPSERWVNHPSNNAAASRKLEQLTTAAKFGLKVPDTLATQDSEEFRVFYERHKRQVIVKPLATGYIERIGEELDTLIYTNLVKHSDLQNLDDLKVCPTFFQQCIEKQNDVRITILDSEIHAVELLAGDRPGEQRCDIRRNNMTDVTYRPILLPEDVVSGLRSLMRHYKLRFGAIDMAVSKSGEWWFFEINPNGQWAWLDMTAGTKIADSFVRTFTRT